MQVLTIYGLSVIPLTWIAAADIRDRKIPITPLIALIALGVAKAALIKWSYLISSSAGFLLIGLPMLLAACRLEQGDGIGGGDVKLCAVLGFLLGPIYALFILMAALFLIIGFTLLICGKKTALPFGPFVLLSYVAGFILILTTGG